MREVKLHSHMQLLKNETSYSFTCIYALEAEVMKLHPTCYHQKEELSFSVCEAEPSSWSRNCYNTFWFTFFFHGKKNLRICFSLTEINHLDWKRCLLLLTAAPGDLNSIKHWLTTCVFSVFPLLSYSVKINYPPPGYIFKIKSQNYAGWKGPLEDIQCDPWSEQVQLQQVAQKLVPLNVEYLQVQQCYSFF